MSLSGGKAPGRTRKKPCELEGEPKDAATLGAPGERMLHRLLLCDRFVTFAVCNRMSAGPPAHRCVCLPVHPPASGPHFRIYLPCALCASVPRRLVLSLAICLQDLTSERSSH